MLYIIVGRYFSLSGILERLCGFSTRASSLSLSPSAVCGMSAEDLQSNGIPQTTKSYKITQHTAYSNRNQINVPSDWRGDEKKKTTKACK